MKIIASYNLKGGVGKTTTAVNLAYLSAAEGRRTLLWDLDPQGAATYLLRIAPHVKGGSTRLVERRKPIHTALKGSDYPGLDLLPADFTYRNMDVDLAHAQPARRRASRTLARVLAQLADEYDVVFLDTPPSMSLVSENVLHAADVVVVPLIPTVLAIRTFDQLQAFLATANGHRPRLHAFFSMTDRRKALHRQIIAELPRERGDISPIVIPALALIEQMTVRRAALPDFAPRSPATRAYRNLWHEIAQLADLDHLPEPANQR